ncbi:hypothetical protein BJP41_06765 [Candidatus Williamhamiltonella defendens]|uniref:Uncharacterized protein n=1 Tax=Candidatus Williamhamiltonella defendens TaxID=138072 RepID=A0A2D3T2Y9_9ENTR|nr:hypothetical protein BJP41_06765 [Candidatus Hamiltonella defensa]ATW32081.1 hypothetical protein BJP42_07055 [Candidatus Hamiltonella defensa]
MFDAEGIDFDGIGLNEVFPAIETRSGVDDARADPSTDLFDATGARLFLIPLFKRDFHGVFPLKLR